MKNYFGKAFSRYEKVLIALALGLFLLVSCKDDYYYDNKEPEWLGSSIYDYLKTEGHYTNTVKLIDDLGYSNDLLGGSNTLFVANDSSFNVFFKNNPWGVKSYGELTLSQKKMLLRYSTLNSSYVLEKLSNYYSYGNFFEGSGLRRLSELSIIDSIPYDKNDDVPFGKYWNSYHNDRGIHLLKGNDINRNERRVPFIYITQSLIDKYNLTSEDLSKTFGIERVSNDAHLFNNKVLKRDITCKNGYIHVLQNVMIPPANMAQYLKENSKISVPEKERTSIFSKLMDRFSVPYYDAASTISYRILHPEFTDSIYSKSYFTANVLSRILPDRTLAPLYLPFSPGDNNYYSSTLQADAAAIFAPSDKAMKDYFASGFGNIMYERFGSWDSIPDDIVLPFIKRHMRSSLLESVPSRFSKMVDEQNYRLPIEAGNIEKSYTGVNGEVYVTNKVYPPVDYLSVYSPVLLSRNTQVMNYGINISESNSGSTYAFYKLYLNSLTSHFSLFVPTDEVFSNKESMYIDPISYGQNVPTALKFWYDKKTSTVSASVFKYDKVNDLVLDSIGIISDAAFLKNRLWSFLDSHVIVGDVTPDKKYYITKANDIVYIDGTGSDINIKGGDDLLKNRTTQVSKMYTQDNGTTYFINRPINQSLRSVYKVLSETPEFSSFYQLVNGVSEDSLEIFGADKTIDSRIKFFNAYRYTVYVPTNAAIQKAIDNGTIKTWETINSITEVAKRKAATKDLVRFLRYHFQDEAVFCGQDAQGEYQSATIKNTNNETIFGTSRNKYYKIGVTNTSEGGLLLTMESSKSDIDPTTNKPRIRTATVSPNGLHNIITKDFIFGKTPIGTSSTGYKNADGTGVGDVFSTSKITSSASAVIHQIDNVLTFE